MTLSIMTRSVMTLSKTILNTRKFCITRLNIMITMTIKIMALSITTLKAMILNMTITWPNDMKHNDTKQNDTQQNQTKH